jgi:lysozyme family protein
MNTNFEAAFQATMRREGGFVLHNVQGDRGGQTYAGIARNFHPNWSGWAFVDRGETPPTELVREFYKREFWDKLRCDDLPARTAAHIFDFGVNAGIRTAVRLAQIVCGATPDGVIGPRTVAALQAMPESEFEMAYTIAKISRYAEIVNRDRSQSKFLLGWINRALGALT